MHGGITIAQERPVAGDLRAVVISGIVRTWVFRLDAIALSGTYFSLDAV